MSSIGSEIVRADERSLECYLQGALRDGTISRRHRTHRFGQSDPAWLAVIKLALTTLGFRSWIYREGRSRTFWVLETTAPFLSLGFDPMSVIARPEARAFARGYFDADGGMPRNERARLYVQYTQKDRRDLEKLRGLLDADGILCGRIHNPSARIDPAYWRFYVRAASWRSFLTRIGSWHPVKRPLIDERLARDDRRGRPSPLLNGRSVETSDSGGKEGLGAKHPWLAQSLVWGGDAPWMLDA